jgi:phosphatidylglycerophosphate synthase
MSKDKMKTFKDVWRSSNTKSHCVYTTILGDAPGIIFAYVVYNYTKISANFITFMSLNLGLLSGISLLFNELKVAAILFLFSFILDLTDGKVSRLRGTSSNYGKRLDLASDRLVLLALSMAYAYYFIQHDLLTEMLLLMLFVLEFIIFDVFELTLALTRCREHANFDFKEKIRITDNRKGSIFLQIRKYVPSRLILLVFVFFIAPLTDFYLVYLLSIFVVTLRLVHLMLSFFKKT